MKPSHQILAILCCATSVASAQAAETITVFGLHLGGKLKPSFRQCSMKEIGTDVRSFCWIAPPLTQSGWRFGPVIVPNADTRPVWAEHGSFSATAAKDGTLGELRVKTYPADKFDDIRHSIELRFGPPTGSSPAQRETQIATWNRADIKIELICGAKIDCHTTFTSPQWAAVLEQERKKAQAKASARPLSM